MHPLPDSWTFNGDLQKPTFSPSFKQTYFHAFKDNAQGKPRGEERVCHYIVTDGKIQFCPDSWHGRSDIISMPVLPARMTDDFGRDTQD